MQKKRIILTMTTVMLVATLAVASNGIFEVINPSEITERVYLPVSKDIQTSVDDAMYALLKGIYEGQELWDATEQYAEFKVVDKPTQEELNAVYCATEKTGDVFSALTVYRFWEKTNDDLKIYTEIMDKYTSVLKDTDFWYEDAYNELTNNVHGVLNVEDVQEYINDGITTKDISVANVLSRRGVYTIEKILELRKDGKSWAYLAEGLFDNYDYIAEHDVISGIDVIDAAYLSKRTGETMSIYFDIAIKEGSLVMERQKYFAKETAGLRSNLLTANLWDYSEEEKKNMEIRRQGILKTAEANGISPTEFVKLEESGESEMDILNASLIVKEQGVSLEQAVTEVKTEKGAIER